MAFLLRLVQKFKESERDKLIENDAPHHVVLFQQQVVYFEESFVEIYQTLEV